MNQLRDRLAAANPVPDSRCYSREQITATVSMILSDAAQAERALTGHSIDVKALAQENVMQEQTTAPSAFAQPAEIRAASQHRRRRRLMVGLFAGLIVVPTAAAAVVGGMHTGFFGPPAKVGYVPMNVPGEELLNSNDPEILSVVQDLTTTVPLPPGASYAPLLKRYPTAENSLVQRTTLAQDVSYYAQCTWYQDWLTGDATRRAADQPTIDAMPTSSVWRFVTDDFSGGRSHDLLDLAKTIAAETRVGTTTTIAQHIKVNCLGRSPVMENPGPSPTPPPPKKLH